MFGFTIPTPKPKPALQEDVLPGSADAVAARAAGVKLKERRAERAARLPAWSALARQVFLLLPSSAAVERVFSILRHTFGKEQKTAGEDLLETSIFLQYNRRAGSGRA
jgi:hypothetical protein